MPGVKDTQNTPLDELDVLINKNTKTILERYIYASHWCKGKTVLDAASGHGIGSMLLMTLGAKSVTGVDFESAALNTARKYNYDKVKFYKQDLTKPFDMGDRFDVVVSIETFEHLPKEKISEYLMNLKGHLKDKGTILITTPIRRSPEFIYNGGTHLYEYTEEEFVEELAKVFEADKYTLEVNSLLEFRVAPMGILHTEYIQEIAENSNLFFAVIQRKTQ